MADANPLVEAYVEGHWVTVGAASAAAALGMYAKVDHPTLGAITVCPRNFPLRETWANG